MTDGSGCPPEGLMPPGTPVGDPAAMTDEHPHALDAGDFERYCVECANHRHWMGRSGKVHVCLAEGMLGRTFRDPVVGIDQIPSFSGVVDVQGGSKNPSGGEKQWLPLCYQINYRAECAQWHASASGSVVAELLDDMKARGAEIHRELGLLRDENEELRRRNFEMVAQLDVIAVALNIKGTDNGQSQKTTA